MLMKVLKRLSEGGFYSKKSMARELEIDESLLEQIIGQLEKLGYIENDKIDSCPSGCECSGCSTRGGCGCGNSHNININIWKLTDKAKILI